jgi:hypothetical protein
MQNLSAANRQISASTIGQYRSMATPYRVSTAERKCIGVAA